MSRQSQLFLALMCYTILVALPFLEMARLPMRQERAIPATECSGGNLLVQEACARNR